MKLKTQLVRVPLRNSAEALLTASDFVRESRERIGEVLRWGLVALQGDELTLELSLAVQSTSPPAAVKAMPYAPVPSGINAALVVPTGVGASIGGFIGDAGPTARLLSAVCDTLVIHPNVVNGADFYGGDETSPYVDGYTLDQFFSGRLRLAKGSCRRIGLIFDDLDEQQQVHLLNSANAAAAVFGIELIGAVVCGEKIRAQVERSELGHFVGTVHNAEGLIEAADRLAARGAEAIAVVTDIQGVGPEDFDVHYHGKGPNPIGSIEALMSRAITWKTGLPCAHAPAFDQAIGTAMGVIDPRASAEVASGTGLPCILAGLSRAPIFATSGGLGVEDLSAIVVPFDCAGGPPAEASYRHGIPLVAVRSNKCVVGVRAEELNLLYTAVENYLEAAAFLAARRAGVSWSSLSGALTSVKVDSLKRLQQ